MIHGRHNYHERAILPKEYSKEEYSNMMVCSLVRHRSHWIEQILEGSEDTYIGGLATLNLLTIREVLYGETLSDNLRELIRENLTKFKNVESTKDDNLRELTKNKNVESPKE